MFVGRLPHRRGAGLLVVLGLTGVLSTACTGTSNTQVEVRSATTARAGRTTTTTPPDCAQMLPAQAQAAQLLMTMVPTPGAAAGPVADGTVGGFALEGNQSREVGTEISTVTKAAPLPLTVASDEEGGTVQRLRLALGALPAAATFGAGSPDAAATAAAERAAGMKNLGFTMNLAPVADVGSGSGLGTRSYSSDLNTVIRFMDAIVPAIRQAGIVPVVKHWPGIGGGRPDPQLRLPTLARIESLRAKDLVPFDRVIAAGAPAIMVTHAAVPGLTQPGEPTSLSRAAITGELRGRQRFTGLVITDSLGMGAVTATTPEPDAVEKAIAAGADIALVSGTKVVAAANARLVDAISSGRIPADQVLASVRRVLTTKGITGPCLDAVARYSGLARAAAASTTLAGGATTATGASGTGG